MEQGNKRASVFPDTTLNLKRRPRILGALACLMGKPVSDNPYQTTTTEYLGWITGWLHQNEELIQQGARKNVLH